MVQYIEYCIVLYCSVIVEREERHDAANCAPQASSVRTVHYPYRVQCSVVL